MDRYAWAMQMVARLVTKGDVIELVEELVNSVLHEEGVIPRDCYVEIALGNGDLTMYRDIDQTRREILASCEIN